MKQSIDCLQCKAKKLLKQRLDFPLQKRIETRDRLLAIEDQNIVETTVRFSIWPKNWKNDRLFTRRSQNIVEKTMLDFPCDKGIETTDRLPLIQGQNIVETTVWFPIWEKNLKYGSIAFNTKEKKR